MEELNVQEQQKLVNYFNGDDLAATVWLEKYALRGGDGVLLEKTPREMHERLAKRFFHAEQSYVLSESSKEELSEYGQARKPLTYESILAYFDNFKYLVPQGSVMANLGNDTKYTSLSNCVVIPELKDSYGGIFYADQQLAQLYKRRCGVGVDLSNLRPKSFKVKNAAVTTSGTVSFMDRFSNTTREVAQHGRRGALMITLDIRHPEIFDFVQAKKDLTKVTGANISVKVSNDFMRAVREDKTFTLQWPVESLEPEITKEINARELWDVMIEMAHSTAEPGFIFWDQQHFYSTSSIYPQFKNTSTNPCSEIAMQGGDSCRLMAINLYSFVVDPFTEKAKFDYEKLYEVAYEGMRLMDDLVDLELEHIDRIIEKIKKDPEPDYIKNVELDTWLLLRKNGKEGRRTGLGFTGLTDCLAALNCKYGSTATQLQIDALMRVKLQAELDCTVDMAVSRGAFTGYDSDIEKQSDFVSKMMALEFPEVWDRMQKHGRRNVSFSTVAPTGTLSLLTQTSSGIEPVYMLSYKRRKKVNQSTKQSFTDNLGDHWEEFEVVHPKLKVWQEKNPNKSIEVSPYFGCTASELNWEERILVQKTVQKYTTHSISSTINLPKDVAKSRVGEIYMKAWEEGLKGITVYRHGSRDGVLVGQDDPVVGGLKKRPEIIPAEVIRFKNKAEKWIAVIGLVNNAPYEIFTGIEEDQFKIPAWVTTGWVVKVENSEENRYDFQYLGQSGESLSVEGLSRAFNEEYWNYAKLISGMLRMEMPLEDIIQLVTSLNLYDESINNWKSGVARALKHFVKDGTKATDTKCPSCSKLDALFYQEGCLKCSNCGFSECN